MNAKNDCLPEFELVQVHESNGYAEIVVCDRNNRTVYAGNLTKVDNPGQYAPPGYWDKTNAEKK